jgi:hypothetical protein
MFINDSSEEWVMGVAANQQNYLVNSFFQIFVNIKCEFSSDLGTMETAPTVDAVVTAVFSLYHDPKPKVKNISSPPAQPHSSLPIPGVRVQELMKSVSELDSIFVKGNFDVSKD